MVGLFATSCAYLLGLNPRSNDVTVILGRSSRIHLAASIGYSIFIGSIYLAIIHATSSRFWRNVVFGCFLLLLFPVIAFGQVMQSHYAQSWEYQKAFLSDVVQLIGDITDDTIILLDTQFASPLKNPGAVGTNAIWLNLGYIYQFPNDWENKHQIHLIKKNWRNSIEIPSINSVVLTSDVVEPFMSEWEGQPLDVSSIILLTHTPEGVKRINKPIDAHGISLQFKSNERLGEPPYPKGILYEYLIQDTVDVKHDYFRVSPFYDNWNGKN